jgi:3-oxoacyl-[acyl-carrier-protein] synthase II
MTGRVVITGIGPVTSVGIGKDALCRGVWDRQCHAVKVPDAFQARFSFHSGWYVPLPVVSLPDHGIHLTQDNVMQPGDRMAVLATKLAFEDAGYAVASDGGKLKIEGLEDGSAVIGTGLSGLQTAFESYVCHYLPLDAQQAMLPDRPPTYSRMVIPKTMPNSPAAWTSICFGLTGPCHTLNASCASGTYAIGEAFRRIRAGYDQLMLTGGVECLQDRYGAIMRGFDVLGALTRSEDGRPNPFSKDRSGFLFAEGGACLLVLEELERARRRGARVYAEIVDYRANSDASNIVQIDPEGRQILRLLREISTGVSIDYLNTHGTGTVANDAVEARVIQALFGNRNTQPLLNSTKGILGHTLGASGAIEAAVTALSIARDTVHGNLTSSPMDNLNLPLESVNTVIDRALSVSYGFGGHNGALLFRNYDPHG